MIRTGQDNIHNARETQKIILEAAVTAGIDDAVPMKLAIFEKTIAQGEYEANVEVPTQVLMTQSLRSWIFWRTKLHRFNTKQMWTFPL